MLPTSTLALSTSFELFVFNFSLVVESEHSFSGKRRGVKYYETRMVDVESHFVLTGALLDMEDHGTSQKRLLSTFYI